MTDEAKKAKAKRLIERYRLLNDLAMNYYCDRDIPLEEIGGPRNPEMAAVERLLDVTRRQAVLLGARCGWLSGLEYRDECGEVMEREPEAGRAFERDDTCFDFGDHHFALPGSPKYGDEAMIEALEARAAI